MAVAQRKTNEQTNLEAGKKPKKNHNTNDRSISANGGQIEIEDVNGTADVLVHSIFLRFFFLFVVAAAVVVTRLSRAHSQ